jgi:acyl-CoA dehydrogenase
MDFEFSDSDRSLMREAALVAEAVEPIAAEADASSTIHTGVLGALKDSRLGELTVPAEYGGRFSAVDPFAVCLVREVLMATSSHLDSLFALQGIGSYAVSMAGSPELKDQWLPRVASFDALAALAITEPEAGSDVRSIATTVTKQKGNIVLQGEKSFISNAGSAAFYTVLAREDDTYSAVLVPGDLPGIAVEPSPELIAPHVLGDVTFDNVILDEGLRLGRPGQGMELVLATLAVFRVSVAGAAIGLAEAALREATRHANVREQFGRALARHGPVAVMLADCWTELEAARLLTYRSAIRARTDALGSLHDSSMAKLAATEMAARVVDRCVQIMGRWGIIHESKIERLYRQARPMRIYEGASDVLRLGIARALSEDGLP